MSTYPTSSSLQSRSTIPLTAILFEFLYPWILFPHTGNIPDKMICPNLACFVFFSSFLYFSTIAVVPSLSVLFVPTCTSMVPPFPLHTIFSTEIKRKLNALFEKMQENAKQPPVNELWNTFKITLLDGMREFIPQKMTKFKHCLPWVTLNIRKLMRSKRRLHTKFKKTQCPKVLDKYK